MVLVLMLLVLSLLFVVLRLMQSFPLSFPKRKLHPDRLQVIYGGPGSGKSTYLALESIRALKSGIPVYSNVPIKGCYKLDVSDLGKYLIPEGSLVVVDEIGAELNNRDFSKNFVGKKRADGSYEPSQALRWWKQHRHEGVECICASQGFDDMDKKISTLGSHYFICRKIGFKKFQIVYCKELRKKPDLDEITHQPIDGYYYKKLMTKWCFAPAVWKYFDSFSKMGLPEKEWQLWDSLTDGAKASYQEISGLHSSVWQ